MSKHVLLTGGLGFIGHHTVSHFLDTTDWNITVLDALRFVGRTERLTALENFDPNRVRVFWHDLRAPINEMLSANIGDVDYIINMASDSHVDRSIDFPVDFVTNNVALVLNMLEYSKTVLPEKFIQIGTDEIFGPAPDGYSHKEEDRLKPSNPYAASKAAQELIAYSEWRTYGDGVPLFLTRTMNNFGSKQDAEKMIPGTIKRLLAGQPALIHARPNADGTWSPGSRVWLHARNHADALRFILQNIDSVPYGQGEPPTFNIAGDKELNNLELVEIIGRTLEIDCTVEYVDFHSARPGHDRRYSLDGVKLKEAGWVSPVPLEESLKETILWYRDNPHWL